MIINSLIRLYLEHEEEYKELANEYDMHLKAFEQNINILSNKIQNNLKFLQETLPKEIASNIDYKF